MLDVCQVQKIVDLQLLYTFLQLRQIIHDSKGVCPLTVLCIHKTGHKKFCFYILIDREHQTAPNAQ